MSELPATDPRAVGPEYLPYGAFVIEVYNRAKGESLSYSLGVVPVDVAVKKTLALIKRSPELTDSANSRVYLMQAFEQVHERPYVVHWGPDGNRVWTGSPNWLIAMNRTESGEI
jgi:hypothetical protein